MLCSVSCGLIYLTKGKTVSRGGANNQDAYFQRNQKLIYYHLQINLRSPKHPESPHHFREHTHPIIMPRWWMGRLDVVPEAAKKSNLGGANKKS